MLHDCEVAPSALDQSQPASYRSYVLVALRLTRLAGLNETQPLYYSKTQWGNPDLAAYVYRPLKFMLKFTAYRLYSSV